MSAFDRWLDDIVAGETRPTVSSFARSALTDLPRVETPVRRASNRSAWPAEVWDEMERIWRGADHA